MGFLLTLTLILISILTIFDISDGCQSMNGISRRAILLGLDDKKSATPGTPTSNSNFSSSEDYYPGPPSPDSSSNPGQQHKSSIKQQLSSSKAYLSKLNHTLGAQQQLDNNINPDIRYVFPTTNPQRNASQITAESLSKAQGDEYIGFKYINITEAPNDTYTMTTAKFLDQSVEMLDAELSQPARQAGSGGGTSTSVNIPAETNNILPESTETVTEEEEDVKVNNDWGGECKAENWRACYNITVVGNFTVVHPNFPKDRRKNLQTQLDCFDPMEAKYFPWLCLRNGWTVNRCHIYCMSKCNRDLLYTRKWDFYVLHEGACKTK